MSLSITRGNYIHVTVLICVGEIKDPLDCLDFQDEVRQLIGLGRVNILLNLTGTTYINSSGLGSIIAALSKVRRVDGELKVCGLSEKVRKLLQTTKLLGPVFEDFSSEEKAIQSFPSPIDKSTIH